MADRLPQERLTVITDERLPAEALLGLVGAALEGGCRLVQLRRRRDEARLLFELATELRRLTRSYGARLVINERLDLAMACQADGIHLPAAAMDTDSVRRLAGPDMLVGRSVHSLEEIDALLHDGIDYVHFGPVYQTESKRTFGSPQGLTKLARAVKRARGLPVIAVGGIDRRSVGEVAGSGAWGAAVIGAVSEAADPRSETAALLAGLASAAA